MTTFISWFRLNTIAASMRTEELLKQSESLVEELPTQHIARGSTLRPVLSLVAIAILYG